MQRPFANVEMINAVLGLPRVDSCDRMNNVTEKRKNEMIHDLSRVSMHSNFYGRSR